MIIAHAGWSAVGQASSPAKPVVVHLCVTPPFRTEVGADGWLHVDLNFGSLGELQQVLYTLTGRAQELAAGDK